MRVGYSGGIVGRRVALVESTVAPRLVLLQSSASAVLKSLLALLLAHLSHWNKYFHVISRGVWNNTCWEFYWLWNSDEQTNTVVCWPTITTLSSSRWHCCFISGRCYALELVRRQNALIVVFMVFPSSLSYTRKIIQQMSQPVTSHFL
jgi:hypothetical protein